MAAQEREREEATPPSESNFVTAPPRKAKGLAFIPSSAGELLHRCQIYHPRYPICTRSPLIASPLPSPPLLSFSATLFGREANPTEARPSADRKSDYELTCRCFFRVYYARVLPRFPSPWGRLQLSRLLFRNPPRILPPTADRGEQNSAYFSTCSPVCRVERENASSDVFYYRESSSRDDWRDIFYFSSYNRKKNVTRIVTLLTSIIIKKSIETNNLFCQFYFYVINRIFLVTRYFRTGGYSYRTEKETRKKKKKNTAKIATLEGRAACQKSKPEEIFLVEGRKRGANTTRSSLRRRKIGGGGEGDETISRSTESGTEREASNRV